MKRLLLLRHAESEMMAPMEQDIHRTLTKRGLEQAFDVGVFLAENKKEPDFILTSNATRTLQTMEELSKALARPPKFEKNPMLFRTSPDSLIDEIKNFGEFIQTALIINHNPAIHELALLLSGTNINLSNHDDFEKIQHQYPPATLSVIDCDIDSWKDFDIALCSLLRVHLTL